MVADSGAAVRAGAGKPVNLPVPVRVEESAARLPVAVAAKHRQAIAAVIDRWRIDDEWWRSEPVSRFYYTVLLASGQKVTVYKDLVAGGWFRQN